MQASGTSEGLRSLIDSTLPKSIKKVVENRGLFGPAIFAIGQCDAFNHDETSSKSNTSTAINIMSTFVHNEPTSLTILQEAGVPEAFYNAIDKGLESANEVS